MRAAPVIVAALFVAFLAPAAQTVVGSSRAPVGSCSTSSSGPSAFIELAAAVAARDTLATVRVCLVTGTPSDPAASFHGEIQWDSARATAATIARPRVGMVIENATKQGRIIFAGASPSGFPEALALAVTLRLARAGSLPPVTLALRELNTVAAKSLASVATVTGWPAASATPARSVEKKRDEIARVTTTPAAPPRIARLTPAFAIADTEEPPVVEIVGQSFAAEGNTVTFGPVVLRNITSANGGTLIRLTVPREASVSEEAPPVRLTAGTYRVSVRTARGQSNSVDFEIR